MGGRSPESESPTYICCRIYKMEYFVSGRVDTLKRFRYAAGLSAPLYLLALSLLRERIPGGLPFLVSVAIGPLVAAIFFVTYLLAWKRDDRVPDLLPFLVWGSAAAM